MKHYKGKKVKGKKVDVHRLVLEEKIGRKLRKNEVAHHIDEDKQNNSPDNLELMTRKAHAKHHGRELRTKARLTIQQVIDMRKLFLGRQSNRAIGELFGVAKETVRDIRSGKSWSWV